MYVTPLRTEDVYDHENSSNFEVAIFHEFVFLVC